MKHSKIFTALSLLCLLSGVVLISCSSDKGLKYPPPECVRDDCAYPVEITPSGSLQNPAWSPSGNALVLTRFRNGYNTEPADLFVYDLLADTVRVLVSDGSGNINLPGSCWNPVTGQIVFASTREPHDEIFVIDESGVPGDEIRITNRENKVAYEPSFSPDGLWVVFESHLLDVEENGIIIKYKIDGTQSDQELTGTNDDCRQPNWSPAGNLILYQKLVEDQWDLWVMDTDGTNHRQITSGDGDKTDASFSPEGQWIVYSAAEPGSDYANLFIISVSGGTPVRVTNYDGYDGAPSWSPNSINIAFESRPGDQDDTSATAIWIIDVPEL